MRSLTTLCSTAALLAVASLNTHAAPSNDQAAQLTRSLLAEHKQFSRAQGDAQSSTAQGQLQRLERLATERHAHLVELMERDPAAVARVAIPEAVRAGMPEQVQELLLSHVELDGEVEVYYEDYEDLSKSRLRHILKTPFGERIQLHLEARNHGLKTGDRVQLSGALLSRNHGHVDADLAVDDQPILVLGAGAEDGGSNGGMPQLTDTLGAQDVLVMMVNFQDDSAQPWTQADMHSIVDGQVSDFIAESSYGQTTLNVTTTNWMSIAANSAGCDTATYAELGRQAAVSAGYDVDAYNRHVFVFPRNSDCGFTGLGTVGGAPSTAWVNGLLFWNLYAHELGHNLGLHHSHDLVCSNGSVCGDGSVTTYGDLPDVMGAGHSGHFNAYQKDRLGWFGDNITSITASGNYDLKSLSNQDSAVKALKVQKSADEWYYMEYRQAEGFDSGISMYNQINFLNGVTIHSGSSSNGNTSYLLDMTPGSADGMNDAALEQGFTYEDNAAGVSITTQWADSTGANVDITLTQQSCTSAQPAVVISGGEAWVSAGSSLMYQVTVTNNDSSVCASSSFNLSSAVPSGWSASFANSAPTLAPGASVTTNLLVSSVSSASNGFYDFTVAASNGSYSVQGTDTFVIDNPVVVNNAPVASNDSASTDAGNSVVINVLSNDSDADGDSLSITSATANNGSVSINGNSLSYTPSTGFSGSDTINYTISDGQDSASASVSVTVNAVITNTSPQAYSDSVIITSKSVVSIAVLSNDVDPEGDNLSISSVTQGAKGSVSINADGSLRYAPAKSFKNSDSFTYTITDGEFSSQASVTITLQSSTDDGGSTGGKGRKNK